MIDKVGNVFYIDELNEKRVLFNLGFKACGDAYYFK
jgi:hypothetical protein